MMIGPGLRPSVLAAKELLAQGRQKIRQRHDRGSPGVQVCGATTDLLDRVMLGLYESALADLGEAGPEGLEASMALVAHGGYGRRDVAPYSDVDLMILHTPQAEDRVARLAQRLMRDVFDSGLTLGHSVRTVEQACQLAFKDATICTSLIESRYLAGAEPLFTKFLQKFQHRVHRRSGNFIAAIEAARNEERNQFGETVYLLEPNIKRSSGGLRDIQLMRWIGFARYAQKDPDSLQLLGALSKEDQQVMRQAIEFLLRLRNEMHFHAEKAADILERTEQVRIAAALGYTGDEALLPVEKFMREYFSHTHAVSNVVKRFVASARPGSFWIELLSNVISRQAERDFRIGPRQISATRRGLIKVQGRLDQILRLADLANMYDKQISHATSEAIRRAVPQMSGEISPEAAAHFVSLLSVPARLGPLLRMLHEMGVLERIIPAFVHARSLIQFNHYHKYTVDEHCLRAVEEAANFQHNRGPLGDAYRQIKQKQILHLALLIHDLGKGFPEDHSDVGRTIAHETAARLGLSAHDTENVKLLVHKHLVMSHLAFRRDTSDEELVLRFAVEIGSPEALQMLFVLTCADLAAVGPGVLNTWKIEVLTELYQRAMQHLAGGAPAPNSQDRMRRQREAVWESLKNVADRKWYEKQIAALPPAYLDSATPQQVAADLERLHALRSGEVIALGRYLPERHAVEYSIATHELICPGVFHRLTGALASRGLGILSAEINTLPEGLVLDRFCVHDPDYSEEPPQDRIADVTQVLSQSLLSPNEGLPAFRRVWRSAQGRGRGTLPSLPTQVRVDNNTSDRFTILDIFAADRQGLLYAISRTLFELGLSVSVAKIGTYLDQVVDVFYVTDQEGRKILDERRLEAIRDRLFQEIEKFERQEDA